MDRNFNPTSLSGAAAVRDLDQKMPGSLPGSCAAVCGRSEAFESHPRTALIGFHWEMNSKGDTKQQVIMRVVAWAAGKFPND